MSTNKSVAFSAGVVGLATLLSRLLGFFRDLVIARLFGVYLYAQAFVVAFRLPNLLRELVAEGAANAAVVPVLSEVKVQRPAAEYWELVNILLNVFFVVLTGLTLLGVAAAPLLVRLMAPGFVVSAQQLELTVRLSRYVFPYILLVGLAAYATGILNSLKHFSVPAFAPCLLNAAIILCALFFGEGIRGLAGGVLIGGVLQLLVQVPVLWAKGFRLRPGHGFFHPRLKEIGRLLLPRLGSFGIYQINNFVDTIFGSLSVLVGAGGVAALYFAYRLVQFPLGVFSTALAQVLLPTLSRQLAGGQSRSLAETLSFGMRVSLLVLFPASAGMLCFSRPLIAALFGGGRFDLYAVDKTAQVLFCYSIGLSAYGLNKILQTAFFSLKDTRTPVKVSAVALGLNIALNTLLIVPLGISGIALATSVSGILSCFLLGRELSRRLGKEMFWSLGISALRISGAAAGMGLAGLAVYYRLLPAWGRKAALANLGVAFLCCGVFYAGLCLLLRVDEMRRLLR